MPDTERCGKCEYFGPDNVYLPLGPGLCGNRAISGVIDTLGSITREDALEAAGLGPKSPEFLDYMKIPCYLGTYLPQDALGINPNK